MFLYGCFFDYFMPGLLVHLSVAVLGGFCLKFFKKDIFYIVSFFIGSLVPDLIKFGFPFLRTGSLDFRFLCSTSLYKFLDPITHSFLNWFYVLVFVFLVLLVVFRFDWISNERFRYCFYLFFVFFVGVFIHLVLDFLITDHGYWV